MVIKKLTQRQASALRVRHFGGTETDTAKWTHRAGVEEFEATGALRRKGRRREKVGYPNSPWTLKGYAISTVHLVDVDKVRHLIPSELNIISVLPGKTLSVVYVSRYGAGSVLEYSELIVAPAMVSYQAKFGGWVSHIYVDNPDSVAGGREIWGLPKEMAEFTWEDNKRVIVRQDNNILCSLDYNQQSLAWRQWLAGSAFSTMGADLLMFGAEFESRLGLIGSRLEVPAESPFGGINLGQPFLTVRCEEMSLQVATPQVVGQTNYDRITNRQEAKVAKE